MAKKEKSSEQQLKELCKEIKLEIDRWHSLRTQGGHDPFYGDGYNMNLTRNHVIYDKGKIKELCEENSLDLPEEYHIPTPPEVPNYYMAKPTQEKAWRSTRQTKTINGFFAVIPVRI